MDTALNFINSKLEERQLAGNYRALKPGNNLIDFCSNDYLGFARSGELMAKTDAEIKRNGLTLNGSTGSRLISGNSDYAGHVENYLAGVYHCGAALLFNSGYDANLGLFSSLPQKGDTVIADELVHASIIDGIRLGFAARYTFRHNDPGSLEDKLRHAKGICYVVIESVYSMDGDSPDLTAILQLTKRYNANLIVDEAHAIGIHGTGLVKGNIAQQVFARIITFGKALGCHGAAVLGSIKLKAYLVNFARPFIYTTAPPPHQLACIKMAYEMLGKADKAIDNLEYNIRLFKNTIGGFNNLKVIGSNSAIQCILVKDNNQALAAANGLQQAGLDVRAIMSPTVAAGSERLRICLHSYNTEKEIMHLIQTLMSLMYE